MSKNIKTPIDYSFVFKNVKSSESLKSRLIELFDRFEKINGNKSVKFVISERKTKEKEAKIEATITIDGKIYRAEATDSFATPFIAAADKVYEKMKKILRREKDKNISLRKEIEAENEPAPKSAIIREKNIFLRPMLVDDAIEEMVNISHSFYLFINIETGEPSVVYKRKDGGYGIINATT